MDAAVRHTLNIPVDDIVLKGELVLPPTANAIIVFSHGSGSSRLSPRNRLVADYLQRKHFATLLFDLLTEEEDRDYYNRFDIGLLTGRLEAVTSWLEEQPETGGYRVGYFGASTGAASALRAAATMKQVGAVVSRGGRPDMAEEALQEVEAPTLLIVGSLDYEVLELNQQALSQLRCTKELAVVPGATHLFEEPGTMEEVMKLAAGWFEKYLGPVLP
jgi:putative phosphoribosyl transferase